MEDFCVFVDKFFVNIDMTCHILSIVLNLSEKTPLVPMLVDAHYADKIVGWLDKLEFQEDDKHLPNLIIQTSS